MFGAGAHGLAKASLPIQSAAHYGLAVDPLASCIPSSLPVAACAPNTALRNYSHLQVGADEKLSSVIDGESLVNDGSALVIFLVLQQIVQGAHLTVAQVSRAGCCTRCRAAASLWQQAHACRRGCATAMRLNHVLEPSCACLPACLYCCAADRCVLCAPGPAGCCARSRVWPSHILLAGQHME